MRSRIGRTRRVLTSQEGTEGNGYHGTGPSERIGSVNERSSHHLVVSGQLHDAQASTPRPRTSVKNLRKSFFTPLTHSVIRLPGNFIWDSFARALQNSPLTHSPKVYYDHTVHMGHLGRSGTLLDPPYTLESHRVLKYIPCCGPRESVHNLSVKLENMPLHLRMCDVYIRYDV